jgi:hypothetical protein
MMKRGFFVLMLMVALAALMDTSDAGRGFLHGSAAMDGNCGKITCFCFHPFCPPTHHAPIAPPPPTTTPPPLLA